MQVSAEYVAYSNTDGLILPITRAMACLALFEGRGGDGVGEVVEGDGLEDAGGSTRGHGRVA